MDITGFVEPDFNTVLTFESKVKRLLITKLISE